MAKESKNPQSESANVGADTTKTEQKSNKNADENSTAKNKLAAHNESRVQGDEIKAIHLKGEELQAGTKEAARRMKFDLKEGVDSYDAAGRKAEAVIVHPHRLKQPHRIEQEFPEVEIVYGALDEDKRAVLNEATAKGIEVHSAMTVDEIRSIIDEEESARQEAAEKYDPDYDAQVQHEVKVYSSNQLHLLNPGQIVTGDLARELVASGYAIDRDQASSQ